MDLSVDELRALLNEQARFRSAIRSIEPLAGGLTNRSFRVETATGRYVVRVPGAQTDLLGINRAAEKHITTLAGDAGIGPRSFELIPRLETVVTEFLDAHTATPDSLHDPEVLSAAIAVLKRLHSAGPVPFAFPVFQIVRQHALDARKHGRDHHQLDMLLMVAKRIENVFEETARPSRLCHNDLLPANLLLTDQPWRVWLIDFEYAGMNALEFDLANLSVNAGLSHDLDEHMLRSYFGRVSVGALARLQLMKVVSELREGLWGLVQSAISATPDEFAPYASSRLEHCAALAAESAIGNLLRDAVTP